MDETILITRAFLEDAGAGRHRLRLRAATSGECAVLVVRYSSASAAPGAVLCVTPSGDELRLGCCAQGTPFVPAGTCIVEGLHVRYEAPVFGPAEEEFADFLQVTGPAGLNPAVVWFEQGGERISNRFTLLVPIE